jgi:type I restriction enzyme, S subunit
MAGEWDTVELERLVDPDRGISYGIVQPGAPVGDGVPIIRVSDVREGRISTADPLRVSPAVEAAYARTRLRGGELLLTLVGTVGEVAIVPDSLAGWNTASAIAVIPVRKDVGSYWVKLALHSPLVRQVIDTRLNTTVQATLNLRDVAQLPILLPPAPERQSIAHILGTLDDKIELNRRMSETLEAMARALFKSWFIDFDPVRAKAEGRDACLPDEVADLFPSRIVDSELGEIPSGWGITSLSHHFDAVKGVSYKGSGLADSGMPLHNLNSVYEGGGYKYEGIKYYNGEFAERHVVQPGDVIVANTEQGDDRLLIGYAAIVPCLFGGRGIASHHIYRLRRKRHSPLTVAYLCHLLNSPQTHDVVSGYANGTTVNMLPIDGVQKPKIILPPTALVQLFDNLAIRCESRREELVIETRTLANLRDSLLPKLVSGELRVKNAEKFVERSI